MVEIQSWDSFLKNGPQQAPPSPNMPIPKPQAPPQGLDIPSFQDFLKQPPANTITTPPEAAQKIEQQTGAAPKPEEGQQTSDQSFWSLMGQSFLRGAGQGITEAAAGAKAITPQVLGGSTVAQQAAQLPPEINDEVTRLSKQPIEIGWNNPRWWGSNIVRGAASSAPTAALGAAGMVGGGMAAGPPGALLGGAAGGGLGMALQTLVPAYQAARARGLDHDAAMDEAILQTGIGSAFGAAMGLTGATNVAGKVIPAALRGPITEALVNLGLINPGLMVAQHQAQKLAGPGGWLTPSEILTDYAQGFGVGAALHGAGMAVAHTAQAVGGGYPITPDLLRKTWEATQGGVPEPPDTSGVKNWPKPDIDPNFYIAMSNAIKAHPDASAEAHVWSSAMAAADQAAQHIDLPLWLADNNGKISKENLLNFVEANSAIKFVGNGANGGVVLGLDAPSPTRTGRNLFGYFEYTQDNDRENNFTMGIHNVAYDPANFGAHMGGDPWAIIAHNIFKEAAFRRAERIALDPGMLHYTQLNKAMQDLRRLFGASDGTTFYSKMHANVPYINLSPQVIAGVRTGYMLFSKKPGTTLNIDPHKAGREAISAFLDEAQASGMPKSKWVQVPEGGLGMYLRLRHEPNGHMVDVANIDFDRRGTGAFTHYLQHLEEETQRRGLKGVRVENIMNPRLPAFLEKRGYVREPSMGGPPSMRLEHSQQQQDAAQVPFRTPDERLQEVNDKVAAVKQELRRELGTSFDRYVDDLFQGKRTPHNVWELYHLGLPRTNRPASKDIPQRLKSLLDQVKFLGDEARGINEEMGGRTYDAAYTRPGSPFPTPRIGGIIAAPELIAAGNRIKNIVEALRKAFGMAVPIDINVHPGKSPSGTFGTTDRTRLGYIINIWLGEHTEAGVENVFRTAAHEFGHVVMYHFFDRAPINVKNALVTAFNDFRQNLPPNVSMNQLHLLRDPAQARYYGENWYETDRPLLSLTPEKQRYWAGFEEWFAENVARWASSSVKPQTLTLKFFASLNRRILKVYEDFERRLPLERQLTGIDVTKQGAMLPASQMKEWLDTLVKHGEPYAADIFAAAQLRSLRANQTAFDNAEETINAVPQTTSTGAGRGLIGRLFGRSGPSPESAAGADRFNVFYKYMISLPQVAKANPHIVGLQRYREMVSMLHLEKVNMMGEAERTLHGWRALLPTQSDALAELINNYMNMTYRSAAEVVNKVRRLPTEAEFQSMVHAARVSDKGLQVFQNVVKDFDRMLERYKILLQQDAHLIEDPIVSAQKLADIDQQIADIRKGPYFPAMRFGDYTLTVRDSADKVVHFETFESPKLQRAAHEKALANFPIDHSVRSGYLAKDVAPMVGLPPGLIGKIADKLSLSPTQMAALDELKYEYSPAQSFAHQFQQKRNVPGYSEDFLRAYANYMFHGANYFTRMKYVDQLRDTIKNVRQESAALEVAVKRDQIANFMSEHLNYLMDPRADFATLRSLMFHWALGFSPAAATLNLSQTLLGTYPYLASKFGSDAKAIAAMGNASRKLSTFYTKDALAATTDPELKGISEAVKQGLISETQANTLAATADGRVLSQGFGGNRAEKMFNTFSRASQFFFEMTEQTNRRVAFRAAWDMAMADPGNKHVLATVNENRILYDSLKLKGFTEQEARAFVTAKDAVESTQYVYAPYARPRFMRSGLASTIFLFHSFTQNTLFYLWNNPGAAARSIILLAGAGGLMGLPGVEDANGLVRALAYHLFGKDFDLEDQVRQYVVDVLKGGGDIQRPGQIMGDNFIRPDILLHGLSRVGYGIPAVMDMLGDIGGLGHIPFPVVDRHNSVSMGNILPVQPGPLLAPQITGPGAGGQNVDSASLRQVQRASGAVFGMAFSLYKFLEQTQAPQGDLAGKGIDLKHWEMIMPTAMRNTSQAFRYYQEGKARNASGNAVVRFDPSEPEHMMELIGQALGYHPERVNAAWDRITAEREQQAFWDIRRQYLMQAAWTARQSGDADTYRSAQEAIRKFNQDLPEDVRGKAITSDALRQSFENKARAGVATESGVPRQRGAVPLARSVQRLYPEAKPDAGRAYPPQGGALGK